jgi:hypothetical protein
LGVVSSCFQGNAHHQRTNPDPLAPRWPPVEPEPSATTGTRGHRLAAYPVWTWKAVSADSGNRPLALLFAGEIAVDVAGPIGAARTPGIGSRRLRRCHITAGRIAFVLVTFAPSPSDTRRSLARARLRTRRRLAGAVQRSDRLVDHAMVYWEGRHSGGAPGVLAEFYASGRFWSEQGPDFICCCLPPVDG